MGANAAITFLIMNEWDPRFEEEELVLLVLSVASGETPFLFRLVASYFALSRFANSRYAPGTPAGSSRNQSYAV